MNMRDIAAAARQAGREPFEEGRVRVVTREPIRYCTGFTLPAGEHEVHHMNPWGVTLARKNSMGHRFCVSAGRVVDFHWGGEPS